LDDSIIAVVSLKLIKFEYSQTHRLTKWNSVFIRFERVLRNIQKILLLIIKTSSMFIMVYKPARGCIPCKVYAEDNIGILTIDSIVICQTHAEDLRRRLLKMHPGL
jgi:hypothetical protein